MMPEEEPADKGEHNVQAEQCVAFILDYVDDLVDIIIVFGVISLRDAIKDALLDYRLEELTGVPKRSDRTQDLFLEPIV